MTTRSASPRTMAQLRHWHRLRQEQAIDPELPIVDAHHHLWWRPPQKYQLTEVMADVASGHNIRATVFVQCTSMYRADGPENLRPVGETEYVNGIAAISASGLFGDQRLCAGIVGYADLRLGNAVLPVLEAHIRAGGDRFRGIRQQAQQDRHVASLAKRPPPADLLEDPDFRRGFGCLARLNLSFDAWVYFTQLETLADLARAYPETTIILNHIGAPLGIGHYAGRRDEVFQTWLRSIRKLAACPNVVVKLGGMGMAAYGFGFERHDTPASSIDLANAWRPYIAACIDAFGVARCMFESNFPVDFETCSYVVLWNAFKRITAHCSVDEKRQLFEATATRIYRLNYA